MVDIRKQLNTFTQFRAVGQISYYGATSPELQTVQLTRGSIATLVPGMPVKLVTGVGAAPLVEVAIPGTDDIFGLVVWNPKVSSFKAADFFQVTSTAGSEIALQASTTLLRGSKVGLDLTTYKLVPGTDTNYIGTLLDDASTNDIVDVMLAIPLNEFAVSA